MRSIDRSTEPMPPSLAGPEVQRVRAEIADYYKLPRDVRSRRRVPLVPKLWMARDVAEALERLFHSKCAFCEIWVGSQGEIHHFRPTANAADFRSGSENTDYYGWLAYEWRNLLLACPSCARAKSSYFPVRGLRARVMSTWNEVRQAEHIDLVDPTDKDPWKHFTFDWSGEVHGKTHAGDISTHLLNLNRPDLTEARRQVFSTPRQRIESFAPSLAETLGERISATAPFAGSLSILLYDAFRAAHLSVGLPAPSRSWLLRDLDRASKSLDDDLWRRVLTGALDWSPPPEHVSAELLPESLGEIREVRFSPRPSRMASASAQITRVHIENFKGLAELSLDFATPDSREFGAPCGMLLGENSTGKSSVLQAIALSLMGDSMRRRLKLNPEDFLSRETSGWHFLGSKPARVTVEFDISRPMAFEINALSPEFRGDEIAPMVFLSYGARRYFGKPTTRRNPISSVRSLFDPLSTISNPGGWLQGVDDSKFAAVSRAMRDILALRKEDNVERDEDGTLFVRAHDRDTPFDRLSDGYRSLFAMVVDIMREMLHEWSNLEDARGVVLIDEIETHLHPRWKLKVMAALRAALPNVQFIATTHDPLCLRGMRNGEVQVLYRDRDTQQVARLVDLPDVRGLRAEQLLTSDYFGLDSTSDPEVESALEAAALGADRSTLGARSDASAAGGSLLPLQLLGDTAGQQIINEAIRRYLNERQDSPAVRRSQVREEAVSAVLGALRTIPRSPQR